MKKCPRCGKTYTDPDINFCLNDGELLSHFSEEPPTLFKDDEPPTITTNPARVTDRINWQPTMPPVPYRSPEVGYFPHQPAAGFYRQKGDQTFAVISLFLGIFSLVMVCCYGGIWLGLPAAILGFIGMRNADKDPLRYGGKGMAVGGMILGLIALFLSIMFILIQLASMAS